jgi:hypothetical protein
MKLRHLASLAAVTGALALPATTSAAPVPPGPGPVLFCGTTVGACVNYLTHLFVLSCGQYPECPPAPATRD